MYFILLEYKEIKRRGKMKRKLKHMCFIILCLFFICTTKAEATVSTTIYNAKGYKVLLHTPDNYQMNY